MCVIFVLCVVCMCMCVWCVCMIFVHVHACMHAKGKRVGRSHVLTEDDELTHNEATA